MDLIKLSYLHRTSASIAFIKKVIFDKLKSKFTIVEGIYINRYHTNVTVTLETSILIRIVN